MIRSKLQNTAALCTLLKQEDKRLFIFWKKSYEKMLLELAAYRFCQLRTSSEDNTA
jgi:hypothetical protein